MCNIFIKELIEIPERVQMGTFMLRLAKDTCINFSICEKPDV